MIKKFFPIFIDKINILSAVYQSNIYLINFQIRFLIFIFKI